MQLSVQFKSLKCYGQKKVIVIIFQQVNNRMGMLEHLYTKFDKTFFASMCKELARGVFFSRLSFEHFFPSL